MAPRQNSKKLVCVGGLLVLFCLLAVLRVLGVAGRVRRHVSRPIVASQSMARRRSAASHELI